MDIVQPEGEQAGGKRKQNHLEDRQGCAPEGGIGCRPVLSVHEAHAEDQGQCDPQGGTADLQQEDDFRPHGCLFEGSMKRKGEQASALIFSCRYQRRLYFTMQ